MTHSGNTSIKCVCGSESIEHSHDAKWMCDDCGRFHNAKQLDRLAERTKLNRGELVCH